MTYRIGKPLEEGQSPLRLIGDDEGGYRLEVWHPHGGDVIFLHHRAEGLERVVNVMNERIAGWPIGPFTVEDVRAAA